MKALFLAPLLAACLYLPPAEPPAGGPSAEVMFWDLADALAREMPLEETVVIAIVDLPPQFLGMTRKGLLGKLQVLVDGGQEINGLLDTLVHEWAHAVVWNVAQPDPHDELWGIAYSRAYRIKMAAFERWRKVKKSEPAGEATGGPAGTVQGETVP